MRDIYKRIIGHFVITKNKVIQAELRLINQFYLDRNKTKSLVRVLEIGPGERNLYKERYNIDNISINLTLIDANSNLISKSISKKLNTKILKGIVPSDLSKFRDKTFDVVVCSHVIEHLSKEEGYVLMYELDRITKFVSLISTPNGFSWQTPINSRGKVDWYNAHLSAWTPRELKACGYVEQFGEVGPKIVFGPGAAAKIKFNYLSGILLGAFYPLFQRFPNTTFAFSAIKRHSPTSNDYLRR
jgi:2-polyprenyl-3-methyl-5-hydroxy-6-metoxy-1,4-benzoquinol methylase